MSPARRTGRLGGARGFTFIETTVVLLIIALGTALAVPMIEGGWESREVRRAARQLASTMHYCRGEAVATGQPQELVIDPLKNSIHTTGWGRWAVLTERAVIAQVRGGNDMGDGVVLYDGDSRLVHHLNPTASVVWQLADGDASVDQLATEIADELSLDLGSTREQVSGLVAELDALGLVEDGDG